MEGVTERKAEQMQICSTMEVEVGGSAMWDETYLIRKCLPEINRDEIDLSVEFCGHRFRYPLLISALTGGHSQATAINENLARTLEHFGIGMEIGSQRPLLKFPELEAIYSVARKVAPGAFLVANIGASQLINQPESSACTLDEIQSLIEKSPA